MKKSVLLSIAFTGLLVCLSSGVNAQGVGINSSGNPPDPSAILDASSTTKGTLITRMTTAQRDSITLPAEGLQIFNTTTKCFEFFAYGLWQTGMCATCPAVAAPTAGTHSSSTTQIVWNWNAVSGAIGYKWSTSNNYSGATDNGTNTSYTMTGLTCNTAYTLYIWAYNTCANSTTTLTQTTSACPFTCGNTLTITHTAGTVAPVTKTVNYGTVLTTLGGTGAKCWITQNLGSSNQASSATDATEASAGWCWQFNKKQGYKHDGTTRTPNTAWISSINENSDWVAANDPCTIELGTGWRIPTFSEWQNADANGQVGGWDSFAEGYNDVLKLHTAGYLDNSTGVLGHRGNSSYFWSSTQTNSSEGMGLYMESNNLNTANIGQKVYGFTIRCIKD